MLCQRPYLLQKQHKNYILYSLLLLYLLIIISKCMERQSNRVSEQQRCAPGLHWTRSLCTPAPGPQWTRPLCTTAPCLHLDEALLHYCSLPSTGRGPFCKNFFCSKPSDSTCWTTLQTDNYHLSAYETQLQHPARTLTPSRFCYYLI